MEGQSTRGSRRRSARMGWRRSRKEKEEEEKKEGEEVRRVAGHGRGWRLWNRGSMCRPRVQRVASACALTSSRSLSLFHFLSLPLSSSLRLSGPLIRREHGDNSSPSLSLDDAGLPRASSLTCSPRPTSSCPPPSADTLLSLSLWCFDVVNGIRSDVVGNFSLRSLRHRYRHRPSWVGFSMKA